MPFLIARAPVLNGSIGSLRKNAAFWDEPSVGRFGPWLNLLGLPGWMDLMVRKKWRGSDGHRKRGGVENILFRPFEAMSAAEVDAVDGVD